MTDKRDEVVRIFTVFNDGPDQLVDYVVTGCVSHFDPPNWNNLDISIVNCQKITR